MADVVLEVSCSELAKAAIDELGAQKGKAIAAVHRGIVKWLAEYAPHPNLALTNAQRLRGIENVFREKQGRFRIFYIASIEKKRLVVLMIGFRRDGDADDASKDLEKMLARDDFDSHFAELEIAKPA